MKNSYMKFSGILALFLITLLACTNEQSKEEVAANEIAALFQEKHRPQYHFTPVNQWMNDPNGLVYYKGEYHLFYQHYPDSNVWGPMHWGHAISNDMVMWKHQPISLFPDSLGLIFSGSIVVDWNNTSGFGSREDPPLVAIFTHHLMEGEKGGRNDFQYQSLAYSLDAGRTWTKYEDNPVLANPGIRDFRDPKVSWYAPDQKWIMILAVDDRVHIYSSKDLKSWEFESEFGADIGAHGGVWECPDLFKLYTDDNEGKWVMLVSINPGGPQGGSATQYFLGDFDGHVFTPQDDATRWVDFGADNYAGVTWSDVPQEDGRRLFIGWMSNWQYAQVVPTTVWRSAMTIPRSLVLEKAEGEFILSSKPVEELDLLRKNKDQIIQGINNENFKNCRIDMVLDNSDQEMIFSNEAGEQLVVSISQNTLSIDRTKAGIVDFQEDFSALHTAELGNIFPRSLTIFMDDSSIELFVNDGQLVMTDLFFVNKPFTQLEVKYPIQRADFYEMETIWSAVSN